MLVCFVVVKILFVLFFWGRICSCVGLFFNVIVFWFDNVIWLLNFILKLIMLLFLRVIRRVGLVVFGGCSWIRVKFCGMEVLFFVLCSGFVWIVVRFLSCIMVIFFFDYDLMRLKFCDFDCFEVWRYDIWFNE